MLSRVVERNVKHFPFLQIHFATGVVTSPNYPGNYPNNLEKTETIQVEEGLILSLQFTAFNIDDSLKCCFNIESCPNCGCDHLRITDGDGTTLMEKSCGSTSSSNVVVGSQSIGSSLPAGIRSRSNVVNLVFVTSRQNARTGWSVSWNAVTPGECQQCNLVICYFLFNKIIDNALKNTRCFQLKQTRLCFSFLF